MKKFTWNLS